MFRRLFGREQTNEQDPPTEKAAEPAEEQPWEPAGEPPTRGEGETDGDFVGRLARHYLPSADADRWLQLLRPAVRLLPVDENKTTVLARRTAQTAGRPDVA